MKLVLFSLFAFFSSAFAEPYSYSIVEHPYRFSTYFEMQGKQGFVGRAIKSSLSLGTTYELYDRSGQYEGKGIIQTLSLGSLFAWAKDIDVYDAEGMPIGLIDGQALTTANAKYKFFNAKGEWLATAYLDYASSGFLITSAQGERTLANLRRHFIQDTIDYWDIDVYEPSALDLRLIKAFSVFAIDYQEYFKADR